MCPRWLICSVFRVYEHDILDTGRYQLQPRIWMKFYCISMEPRGGLILLPGDARVHDFKKCKDSNVWKCSLFPALTILGGKERERGCFIQGEELNLSSIPSKAHCRDFFCPFSSPFLTSQTILGEVEVSMIDNYFFTPL